MVKVEAMVIRERVETVIDAVEDATGHVGVTVIEAIGHGRQRGVTARVPRAGVRVAVPAEGDARLRRRRPARASIVVDAIVDAARSGNESGDGLVWASPVRNVIHNRTGAEPRGGRARCLRTTIC